MQPIPDSWPPPDQAVPRMVVPLFPLPNAWLFPGAVVPLHIFEPRYRQLVEDSLDGPGRLVLAAVQEGYQHQMAGSPPVHRVAGLGEIGHHQRLPGGRFNITLVGLARVILREVESDRLYRRVEVEPLQEVQPVGGNESGLRQQLLRAIEERVEADFELPDGVPIVHLTDLLLLRTPLPHGVLQELYSEPDVSRRTARALEEHSSRPLLEDGDE